MKLPLVKPSPGRAPLLWLCLCCLSAVTLIFAGTKHASRINDPAATRPPMNPALEKFGEAITFYVSFDQLPPDADLSTGAANPLNPKVAVELKEGLYGKALLSGKTSVAYPTKGNLDLQK